jgi:hypothetical protein
MALYLQFPIHFCGIRSGSFIFIYAFSTKAVYVLDVSLGCTENVFKIVKTVITI